MCTHLDSQITLGQLLVLRIDRTALLKNPWLTRIKVQNSTGWNVDILLLMQKQNRTNWTEHFWPNQNSSTVEVASRTQNKAGITPLCSESYPDYRTTTKNKKNKRWAFCNWGKGIAARSNLALNQIERGVAQGNQYFFELKALRGVELAVYGSTRARISETPESCREKKKKP